MTGDSGAVGGGERQWLVIARGRPPHLTHGGGTTPLAAPRSGGSRAGLRSGGALDSASWEEEIRVAVPSERRGEPMPDAEASPLLPDEATAENRIEGETLRMKTTGPGRMPGLRACLMRRAEGRARVSRRFFTE
jgi:hypothetical protein